MDVGNGCPSPGDSYVSLRSSVCISRRCLCPRETGRKHQILVPVTVSLTLPGCAGGKSYGQDRWRMGAEAADDLGAHRGTRPLECWGRNRPGQEDDDDLNFVLLRKY